MNISQHMATNITFCKTIQRGLYAVQRYVPFDSRQDNNESVVKSGRITDSNCAGIKEPLRSGILCEFILHLLTITVQTVKFYPLHFTSILDVKLFNYLN